MNKAQIILENMKSRRAVRTFDDRPVSDEDLFTLVQAGRFASSGGNLRPHRFLITRDPQTIANIKAFSPGMLGKPPAIIAILLDHHQVNEQWMSIDPSMIVYVDVGTAAQNIMNAAHALGLGSCPVTSYSKSGVREVLALPDNLSVEILIMVGHYGKKERIINPDAPKPAVEQAGKALGDIYAWNVFPAMKVTWGTYPNHVGHKDSPGCFRCHDRKHKSDDGAKISKDCDSCHTVLAEDESDPAILRQIAGEEPEAPAPADATPTSAETPAG